MSSDQLKSIVYHLDSKKCQVQETSELMLPISDQLAVFRNANIFTAGFTIINSSGEYFFQLEEHYNRLLESFKQIYECSQMPFDLDTFTDLIRRVLKENKSHEKPKRIQILMTGGDTISIGKRLERYDNNLFGRAKKVFFIVYEKKLKPRWTYIKGINVFSYPFQRSFASAKLTSYQGGIISQSTLNVINFLTVSKLIISDYYDQYALDKVLLHRWVFQELSRQIKFYQQLSLNQQTRYRYFINDLREGLLTEMSKDYDSMESLLRNVYSITSKQLVSIGEFFQDKDKLKRVIDLEHDFVKNLLHETVYITFDTQPFFLEGPTFSIMGIDQDGNIRTIPLENNTYTKHSENDGVVLESLTMKLVKKLIATHKLPHIERPIAVEEAKYMGALFAISATRVQVDEVISFQPIYSVNGRTLPEPSDRARKSYNKLLHHFNNYVENYRYD